MGLQHVILHILTSLNDACIHERIPREFPFLSNLSGLIHINTVSDLLIGKQVS